VSTSAERRAAQRRLAKQIHERTYKPSNIGAKARQAAKSRAEELIDKIQALKKKHFGQRPKWNAARSRMYVKVDPATGNPRPVRDLKQILADIEEWDASDIPGDWHGLVAISDGEYETAFYYH
jgi:hypothetical protein